MIGTSYRLVSNLFVNSLLGALFRVFIYKSNILNTYVYVYMYTYIPFIRVLVRALSHRRTRCSFQVRFPLCHVRYIMTL